MVWPPPRESLNLYGWLINNGVEICEMYILSLMNQETASDSREKKNTQYLAYTPGCDTVATSSKKNNPRGFAAAGAHLPPRAIFYDIPYAV